MISPDAATIKSLTNQRDILLVVCGSLALAGFFYFYSRAGQEGMMEKSKQPTLIIPSEPKTKIGS
jgi:hypothetical protein